MNGCQRSFALLKRKVQGIDDVQKMHNLDDNKGQTRNVGISAAKTHLNIHEATPVNATE